MVKNYFKTAWRHLTANKFYSILNIFGLAISLTAAIMLLSGLTRRSTTLVLMSTLLILSVSASQHLARTLEDTYALVLPQEALT